MIIQMLFSLPFQTFSPLEATLHLFQYKKQLNAAAGSTVEGKKYQLHILSVVSAHKFLLRVENTFFLNETIKTAAYLPRAIFPPILSRGDEKGITLRPDILHISETWSFRCESHPCVERCDEKQLSL